MGEEAPESFVDFHNGTLPFEHDSKSADYQTDIVLGEKIIVVGRSDDGAKGSMSVEIYDKLSGICIVPTILGTGPSPSEVHSTAILNEDRILILKRDSPSDDCIWFLEVDTPFVKEQKKVLGTEVVAWSKGVVGDGALPVVITGPSGVGKGTLINKLMKDFPSTFGFSVSHTTRAPREKEVDGVHYHFSERSIMEKDIREGKFLESASVHGNLYGTSIEAVEVVTDAGKRCILDIDVQGARSVRASSLEAIFIFICPPSFEELEKRLRARGTETEEQIQKRLRNARAELEQGKSPGLFDHLLVNDDLESCYQDLKKILALNESTNDASYQPCTKKFKLSPTHFVSKMDQKIMIHCSGDELGTANRSWFELDLASLKGGAPGRTRGLQICSFDF